MRLVTEYPLWFIIFCLLCGLVFSFLLYLRDKRNEFSENLLRILMVLRFITISIIAFLLLSPLISTISKRVEKPVIVIAQDNSSSVLVNKDSAFYRNRYPELVRELIKDLKNDFEVRVVSFGEKTGEKADFSFSEKQTDIQAFFEDIDNRLANRNVGALILASDGLYNKGANPLFTAEKFKFPVYTIALGDTNIKKDGLVARVNYNKVVFLGNNFPIEILLRADKLKGSNTVLEVIKGNKVVFTKNINVSAERYSETVGLQLEARDPGIQRYRISLKPMPGEISEGNNIADIFIEVLESKEKVLILTAAPHPDAGAIRSALESSLNYEAVVSVVDEFKDPVEKFNLLILNQLPSSKANASVIINRALAAGIPMLFVVGYNTDIRALNALHCGINIIADKPGFTESLPSLNQEFALFTISNDLRQLIPELPPLYCPFGTYKTQHSATVAFSQQIGSIVTEKPLLLFNQDQDRKSGIILGEGIWKWKLVNYARKNNHNDFNELLTKTVQYLSVRANKSFFRLIRSNNYYENERVIFTSEVYNQSYELINEPEVVLDISDAGGKKYHYIFSKSGNSYHLDAGYYPVGTYSFDASVKVGDKVFRQQGEFTVLPQNAETLNTVADHGLMYSLASRHRGEMVYPADLGSLADKLKKRDDIKSVIYSEKRFNDLVNLPLVMVLLLVLLGAEWFLRKRAGSY